MERGSSRNEIWSAAALQIPYAAINARNFAMFRLSDSVSIVFGVSKLRHQREPPVVEQQPEGFEAELAVSDVLVPVDATAAALLRVVQMKRADVLEPDVMIEMLESVSVLPFH